MDTYTTIQGETWDQVALKLYGRETAMGLLIAANPAHRRTVFFQAGVVLLAPEIEQPRELSPPHWRRLA